MKYTEDQESPKSFHKWVGISVLGAAIGRSIWIPRIRYTIYPNLYVVLVAGSAKCRKSVSLGIGKDLLSEMKVPPGVLSQKITAESLIQCLKATKNKDECYGIIISSELSVFLGGDAVRSGIIPILTDLYDSPKQWTYSTVGRGREILSNVSVAMLGASTKDWLKTSIPQAAIGGGFTSRVIFVFEDSPSKLILFPRENEMKELRKCLVDDLNEISAIRGEMRFDKRARDRSIDWYENQVFENHDERIDGYYGRKHDLMFKISAILSLSEGSNLLILPHHIDEALKILEDNERHLSGILDSVSESGAGENTGKVLSIVKRSKGIKHSEILSKCWRFASATEISEIMKTLTEGHEVEMYLDKSNSRCYRVK